MTQVANQVTHPYHALMEITARPAITFVRGEGSYLWDDTGKLSGTTPASAISISSRAGR